MVHYKNAQRLTVDEMGVRSVLLSNIKMLMLIKSQHTSNAARNNCGFAKVKAYFQNNMLPGNHSFCPLEQGPFGIVLNGTLEENIEQAGLSMLVD